MTSASPDLPFPLLFSEGDLSIDHVLYLWERDDDSYRAWLPQSFAQLLDPDISTEYLTKWIVDLQKFLSFLHDAAAQPDLETYLLSYPLLLDFLDAGMVVVLFKLSLLTEYAIMEACFRAVEEFAYFLIDHTNHLDRHEEVCARVLGNGGLEAILENICIGGAFQKVAAIGCLHRIFNHSHCHEGFTPSQVASLMEACCSYCENGYQQTLDEWKNPRSLLSQELKFKIDDTPDKNDDKLQAWFVQNQEEALDTCLTILSHRTKPVTRRFSLEIIQKSPNILDSFLRITCEIRPSWYLARVTDSISASILVNLMILPLDMVPGLIIPPEDLVEWNAAIQCNEILYSRPNALEMVVGIRNKVLGEDIVSLIRNIVRRSDPKWEDERINRFCEGIHDNRATLLVTSLRLLINLTYLQSPRTLIFLSLLPLSYIECYRIPDCLAPGLENAVHIVSLSIRKENTFELIFHCDHYSSSTLTVFLPPATILGPILLFRALVKLSEAGYGLDRLQKLKSLPPDLPTIRGYPVYLVHIHQIVTSKVIGKLIRMGVNRRIAACRNTGRDRILNKDGANRQYLAAANFISGAELALAISALGSHLSASSLIIFQENKDSFMQANQEVVLCAGNTAEASGRTGKWDMASKFANLAVEFCDTISEEQATAIGWDIASMREKNMRRLDIATKRASKGITSRGSVNGL